jgi:hypothetical protein
LLELPLNEQTVVAAKFDHFFFGHIASPAGSAHPILAMMNYSSAATLEYSSKLLNICSDIAGLYMDEYIP